MSGDVPNDTPDRTLILHIIEDQGTTSLMLHSMVSPISPDKHAYALLGEFLLEDGMDLQGALMYLQQELVYSRTILQKYKPRDTVEIFRRDMLIAQVRSIEEVVEREVKNVSDDTEV